METSILQKIQQELKVPKSQWNNFGKYNYRSAEDIQEALKPILANHGHCLTMHDDMVQVGDRIYVKATASLFDSDLAEVVTVTAFAREPLDKKGMDTSQITGAASSYARKYALNGMFLLDDTKDADSMDNTKPAAEPDKKTTPTPDSTYKKFLSSMAAIKKEISGYPEGEKGYYEALTVYEVKHANEITDMQKGRDLYRDLSKYLKRLKGETNGKDSIAA